MLHKSRVAAKKSYLRPNKIAIRVLRRGAKPVRSAIEDPMVIVVQKLTAVPKRAGPKIAPRSRVVPKAADLAPLEHAAVSVAAASARVAAAALAEALALEDHNSVRPMGQWPVRRRMATAFPLRLMNAFPAWSTSSMRSCTSCTRSAASSSTSDRWDSAVKAAMERTEWPAACQARRIGRKDHNPAGLARLAGRVLAVRRASGTALLPRAAIERATVIAMMMMTDPAAAVATVAMNRL